MGTSSHDRQEVNALRDSYVASGHMPMGRAILTALRRPHLIRLKLRQWRYRWRLAAMGPHSIVELHTDIPYPKNVRLGDFTLIDKYVQLAAGDGEIVVGNRCHLAPFTTVLGHGGVTIGDYVGIAAGARIYSISEWPGEGKRLCGPMIPYEYRGLKRGAVVLEKDSFVGGNSIILPGVTLGEGAVVGANSVVVGDVEPWTVVMGVPARPVNVRQPVTVPDL